MHNPEDHQHDWYQPDNRHGRKQRTEEEDNPHDDADHAQDNQPDGITTVVFLEELGCLNFHDGINDEPDGKQDGDVEDPPARVDQNDDPQNNI